MNDELIKKEPEQETPENIEDQTGESAEEEKSDVDLDQYPLRQSTDDPRWAVRVVKIWMGFVIAALIFILTLLVLGAIYD